MLISVYTCLVGTLQIMTCLLCLIFFCRVAEVVFIRGTAQMLLAYRISRRHSSLCVYSVAVDPLQFLCCGMERFVKKLISLPAERQSMRPFVLFAAC